MCVCVCVAVCTVHVLTVMTRWQVKAESLSFHYFSVNTSRGCGERARKGKTSQGKRGRVMKRDTVPPHQTAAMQLLGQLRRSASLGGVGSLCTLSHSRTSPMCTHYEIFPLSSSPGSMKRFLQVAVLLFKPLVWKCGGAQ